VVPRASGQVNEIIAFAKLKIGAFEISNWLDDKRRVASRSHDFIVGIKKNMISIFRSPSVFIFYSF
jgi:hypothetical protein